MAGLVDVVVTDVSTVDSPQMTHLKLKPCRDLYSVNFCGTRKLFVVADDQNTGAALTATCCLTLKQGPNQLSIDVTSPYRLLPLVSSEEVLVFEEVRDGSVVKVHVLGEPVPASR